MSSKRKSVTEPIEDTSDIVKGELIEEEIVQPTMLIDDVPAKEEKVLSEKVLTSDERATEVSFILAGIRASKEALLKEAEQKVANIQKNLSAQLDEYDKLAKVYSAELEGLKKGEDSKK